MSFLWGKLILGIIFVLFPGFDFKQNYQKHPALTLISLLVGVTLLFISLKPLVDADSEVDIIRDRLDNFESFQRDKIEKVISEQERKLSKASRELEKNIKKKSEQDKQEKQAQQEKDRSKKLVTEKAIKDKKDKEKARMAKLAREKVIKDKEIARQAKLARDKVVKDKKDKEKAERLTRKETTNDFSSSAGGPIEGVIRPTKRSAFQQRYMQKR